MIACLLLGACGAGKSSSGPSTTAPKSSGVRPNQIVPGPAGLEAGSQPQPNGQMWVLAGDQRARTLQSISLVNLQAAPVVPMSPGADALAQSNSGLLAVGQADGGAGSLEFRNGSTGALVTTIPLAGPVTSIAAAQDGFTFYVLVTVDKARSVNAVDAQTNAVGNSIAVPPDSLVALPDPLQHQLYVLENDGNVTTISLSSGQPVATFAVGRSPTRMVLNNDGTQLYVLKGGGGSCSVGVVDTSTQSQVSSMPAPTNCVDLQISNDSRFVYDLVGTPTFGNIQVFPVSS